jgi:hypothetical protein
MKRNRLIVTLLFGLLFAAGLVVAYLQPTPMSVAQAACAERGVGADGLALLKSRRTGRLFVRHETLEFQVRGANPSKKIVVELHQWAFFLPWRVTDVREEN